MARGKIVALSSRAPVEAAGRSAVAAAKLPPGIHAARLEAREGARFVVRTLAGERVTVDLGEDVEEAFVEECLRERRTVLVTPTEDGATLLGALQARRQVARDAHGAARLEGRRVEIDASDGVSIRVGKSALRLDRDGVVRIVGQRMTMDVAEIVRILAAHCELP